MAFLSANEGYSDKDKDGKVDEKEKHGKLTDRNRDGVINKLDVPSMKNAHAIKKEAEESGLKPANDDPIYGKKRPGLEANRYEQHLMQKAGYDPKGPEAKE